MSWFSKEGAIAGLGGCAFVVLFYLYAAGNQDAKQQTIEARHSVESADFDEDFARMTGNAAKAARAASEAASARERLERVQAEADRIQAEKTAQEGAIAANERDRLKKESGGKLDLDAELERLRK